jgi:hypothetical protein
VAVDRMNFKVDLAMILWMAVMEMTSCPGRKAVMLSLVVKDRISSMVVWETIS